MKFRYLVTIESPSASPNDDAAWRRAIRGVSSDQSKVYVSVEGMTNFRDIELPKFPDFPEFPKFPDFPKSSSVAWLACEKCGANWLASDGPDHTCTVPKSARRWLNRFFVFGPMRPLQVVVCAGLLVLIGWLLGKP